MKKKFAWVAAVLCLLPALVLGACGRTAALTPVDTLAQAKIDDYDSAAALQADADVIVRVTKTEKEENALQTVGGTDLCYGHTLSMVRVEEIMKNTSNRTFAVGDEIRVLENQFTYTDNDRAVTVHTNRYIKMQPGNQYYLYMKYSDGDQWFYTLTGLFGKVPVDAGEELLFAVEKLVYLNGNAVPAGDTRTQQDMNDIARQTRELYG